MRTVYLLDLDNTLIDNDQARHRLEAATGALLGPQGTERYWAIYEEVRHEFGYVDFPQSLLRFHRETGDNDRLDRAVLDFPYAEVRYPRTLGVIDVLWHAGTPVVLSDGDPVFQPLKVWRSGVSEAVRGNVLVFPHKEERLDEVALLFPADHYVAVDDKAPVLARIKARWRGRVTTVHVLQGKYADEAADGYPPDRILEGIGGLPELDVVAEEPRPRPRSHSRAVDGG